MALTSASTCGNFLPAFFVKLFTSFLIRLIRLLSTPYPSTYPMAHSLAQLWQSIRRRWLYALLAIAVTFGLVVTQPQPSHAQPRWFDLLLRGVQIFQLSNLSDNQEVALGRQINQQLTARQFRLYRDPTITDYVNRIGQRLVPHSERPQIPYTFQVVDSTQVNAFATMGGFVYVTTGLMRTAENEAELASVISHEIGHIAERHAVKQMRERAIQGGIATAAGLDRNAAVAIGVELALNRPNSRQDELEADQDGLQTLVGAGYAPQAMVTFMQKLLNRRGGSPPTFLSTHPATGDRITRLESSLRQLNISQGDGLDPAAYRDRIRPLLRQG